MLARLLMIAVTLGCLMTTDARAGTIDFAKTNLGLDLSKMVLGSALTNFPGAQKDTAIGPNFKDFESPSEASAEWYRNAYSDSYEMENPGRRLRFGFTEGRLVAIQLFLTSFF